MPTRLIFFLAALLAGFLALAPRARANVYPVAGVVRAPLNEAGEITIAHEDIPGLMPAMTMSFAVKDRSEAAPLQRGDRVRFELHTDGAAWTVAAFKVESHASATAPAPRHAAPDGIHRLRVGDELPPFAAVTEDGKPLTAESLRDRATVVTFIFTRCPVPEFCPAMAMRFGQLQKTIAATPRLAKQVRLLSITLDPEFDTPEILREYGKAVGADPSVWQFATGAKAELNHLAKGFSVYTEKDGVTLNHTLCTALIGADGRVREIWRGNGWKVDEVIAALTSTPRD